MFGKTGKIELMPKDIDCKILIVTKYKEVNDKWGKWNL
jgi:hypothetical protein